jgi:hypothetical protein
MTTHYCHPTRGLTHGGPHARPPVFTSSSRIHPTSPNLPVRPVSKWVIARLALFLLLSGLPILAISAHVFGLISESTSGKLVILPLAAALAAVVMFAPHATDAIIARGFVAGMVACIIYDAFRLFNVQVLGLMGDFIPTMGTWVTGSPDSTANTVVGYVWRYLGDAGGLGVAFYIVAFAVGLDRWSSRRVILAATGFAVFPVWAGLIATAGLAPRGEELLFHLTPAAVTITLIGHVIFGLFLGLGFVRTRERCGQWPWPPLLSEVQRRFNAHATRVGPTRRHRHRPRISSISPQLSAVGASIVHPDSTR